MSMQPITEAIVRPHGRRHERRAVKRTPNLSETLRFNLSRYSGKFRLTRKSGCYEI